MKSLLIGLLSVLSLSAATPLTSYDQRQEGELNVKVDLDNFVIVVARPSPSGFDLLGSMASLFADDKSNRGSVDGAATDLKASDQDDHHDKSKNLDDVALDKEPAKESKEEAVIVLVQTSADTESKTNETTKNIGEIARTLRNLKMKEASHAAEKSKSFLTSKYKFVDSVDKPQSLKLIGDAIEGCGPGRSRDRFGICKQD